MSAPRSRAADAPLPRAVGLAALLVGLQGAGLVLLAAFTVVETLLGRTSQTAAATVMSGIAFLAALALLLVARGLRGRRRWSRSPALLAQLLVVPVAVTQVTDGVWWVGVPLLVWAATVLLLVSSQTVGRQLRR